MKSVYTDITSQASPGLLRLITRGGYKVKVSPPQCLPPQKKMKTPEPPLLITWPLSCAAISMWLSAVRFAWLQLISGSISYLSVIN